MGVLAALLLVVVIGWIALSDRILPAPAEQGDLTEDPTGVYTRTPDEPSRSTLELRDGRYTLDGLGRDGSGSYRRNAGELRFGGDPSCGDAIGRYTGTQGRIDRYGLLPEDTAETLALARIDDTCAARAEALSGEWVLVRSLREGVYGICDPPNEEAAITGHWPEPSGC